MKRKFRHGGPGNVKIGGKVVNRLVAQIAYRCAECLGRLRHKDSGLACKADESHRGYVHKKEAAQIAREREAALAELESIYEIRDGQIVVKES